MPVNIRVLLRFGSGGRGLMRPDTADHPCALPPIRTLTVGPGVPPGQPAADAAGSRTITAGSEFHRPRSTLVLRELVCHTSYSWKKPDTLGRKPRVPDCSWPDAFRRKLAAIQR